jgi:hypothetical protein
MSVCMYVCMYVSMYVGTYVCVTYACMHAYIHTCMYTDVSGQNICPLFKCQDLQFLLDFLTFEDGPKEFPERSVKDYNSTLRNILQERRSHGQAIVNHTK